MTGEELIVRYDAGERNFAGIQFGGNPDYEGLNLQGVNLRGADLRNIDLTGADLTGAILSEAKLNRAILYKAKLYGALLFYCSLKEADLTDATFEWTNATCANFRKARMPRWGFKSTNLTEANFYGAIGITNLFILSNENLIWVC
jgi:uncharacterized protein YjbI with pentapeptide repeats